MKARVDILLAADQPCRLPDPNSERPAVVQPAFSLGVTLAFGARRFHLLKRLDHDVLHLAVLEFDAPNVKVLDVLAGRRVDGDGAAWALIAEAQDRLHGSIAVERLAGHALNHLVGDT